jgi:hypothetical protein
LRASGRGYSERAEQNCAHGNTRDKFVDHPESFVEVVSGKTSADHFFWTPYNLCSKTLPP